MIFNPSRQTLRLLACVMMVAAALTAVETMWHATPACAQVLKKAKRTLKDGQSPNRLMQRMGVNGGDRLAAARALKPLFDMGRKARPGDTLEVTVGRDGQLLELIYTSKKKGRFFVYRKRDKLVASRKRGLTVGDAPVVDKETPKETPRWLKPRTKDPVAQRLGEWFSTEDSKARAKSATAMEAELGLETITQALRAGWAPPERKADAMHHRHLTTPYGNKIEYAVYVPPDYDHTKPTPLHISLHGKGGNGPGTCRMRWKAPQDGVIIACPTSPGGIWHGDHGQSAVLGLYRQMLYDYNVDTERVVLGGFSNGGNGTWQLGARFPWLWSSLTPRSGATLARIKWRQNMFHLPAFITHGTEDHAIGVNHARRMVELLTDMGNPPRYVEVDGGGHKFFTHLNPTILAWMLQQKRAWNDQWSYNQLQHDEPDMAYWVMVHQSGSLEAKIERHKDRTTVRLTARRIPTRLTVFLPDALKVDRKLPVEIVLNDEEVWSGVVAPSAHVLLESFRASGDMNRATPYGVVVRP